MRSPASLGELLERVEVQDGLVDRHRDEVLHLQRQRGAQLGQRQPRQVDLAHDHPLVGDPDGDLAAAEARLGPEQADGCGHRGGVHDLAVGDRAGRQGDLPEALERRRSLAERQLRGAHPGGPDVEAYHWSSRHGRSSQAAVDDRGGPADVLAGVQEHRPLCHSLEGGPAPLRRRVSRGRAAAVRAQARRRR